MIDFPGSQNHGEEGQCSQEWEGDSSSVSTWFSEAHSLLGLESLPLMLACSMVFQANSPDSRSVLAGAQEHHSCPVLLMTILFGWWHLLLWG